MDTGETAETEGVPPRDGGLWRPARSATIACSRCRPRAVDWPVVSWHSGRSTWLLRTLCRACAESPERPGRWRRHDFCLLADPQDHG